MRITLSGGCQYSQLILMIQVWKNLHFFLLILTKEFDRKEKFFLDLRSFFHTFIDKQLIEYYQGQYECQISTEPKISKVFRLNVTGRGDVGS